ncbi:MAG: hypothetical protein ACOZAM_20750 [Pseudomonadota bacterium]
MSNAPEILTKRFRLTPITPDKVSDEWLRWTSDPDLMGQMNARVTKLTRTDLQRYLVAAQGQKRAVVGIYGRKDRAHLGLYETEINEENRLVTLDVLIDQHRYDLANVLRETDSALLSYLAGRFGLEKAVAKVVETYKPLILHLEQSGWRREGVLRQENPSAAGFGRLDVIQFGKLL